MPTILDHVRLVGEEDLSRRPFDALDALVLSQVVYMPMEGLTPVEGQCTLARLWDFLEEEGADRDFDPFQRKRFQLVGECAKQPRYAQWMIHSYVNHIDTQQETQFAAACFKLPDDHTVISFRGTDWSLAGWKEDLNMSFMTVPAQQDAVEYVQREAARTGDRLTLVGHSKGGNLSVYAAIQVPSTTQMRLHRVYSFDGPGVDAPTLHSEGFQRVCKRVESYIPQSSVVGMLLYHQPVYTVVRSASLGILQHDALTWQVKKGAFVELENLDSVGKLTDETLHAWLAEMNCEDRRLLVDTLYQVMAASQEETITGIVEDWQGSALRMLEALREVDPSVRKSVRKMIRSLFGTGAVQIVRSILPNSLADEIFKKAPSEDEAEKENR